MIFRRSLSIIWPSVRYFWKRIHEVVSIPLDFYILPSNRYVASYLVLQTLRKQDKLLGTEYWSTRSTNCNSASALYFDSNRDSTVLYVLG